jgi:dihydrolipoamide dehydrogenase
MTALKDKAVAGLTKGLCKGFGKLNCSPLEVSVDLIDGPSTVVKGKQVIIAT